VPTPLDTLEPKSKNWTRGIVALVAAGLFVWLRFFPTNSHKVDIKLPAATAPATPATATQAPATNEEPVLTGKEVAAAFSDYVGALQGNLFVAQMAAQVHVSQMQQAIQFNDLDKYRSTAEELKESLKKINEDIAAIKTPENLPDDDMPPYEDAMNAATEIVNDYIGVASDIEVSAHTGMDVSSAMAEDAKDVAEAQAKFTSTVQQGYKHFGVKRTDIDTTTLTLKADKAL
jgi:hypothetical protein